MKPISGHKYAIINADDFGWSVGISEGIVRAVAQGVLTSTTIAANMPAAAESLKLLAGAAGLRAGVHLNVSQGPAISERGRAELAGPDGMMNRTAMGVILACIRRPRLVDAIEAEFDAQIRWVLDHGVVPTHLDSHRHAHAFGPIFARVVGLARRYHIPFVRRFREVLPGGGWPASQGKQRRVRRVLNAFGMFHGRVGGDLLATCGTWGIAHTGQINREWLIHAAAAMGPGVTEIMTHPGLVAGLDTATTRLVASREAELQALCDADVREAFAKNGVELINYGQLAQ